MTTETTQGKPCSWCSGSSQLNIGPGVFRDFDSDLSYGIPVCGGCGGLGEQFSSPEFREMTGRITKLRFEYCPIGDEDPLPPLVLLQKLRELESAITELWDTYGRGQECLAKNVKNGSLQPVAERHESQAQ